MSAPAGPVRFGLLSFAHYHANYWAQAIRQSPDAVLAGVWDDDRSRGSEAAERHGTRYHGDLGALLRECDAVGITAETARHADLVEAAAAAGVHVLCEKPIATSLADCDRIERAVERAGITFMQNFPKRFDPAHRELVDGVRRGDLGPVRLVRVRHGHYYALDPAFVKQWYCDPALAGGGALLDEGVHAADLLRWLLGDPTDVRAVVTCATPGLRVDDTGVAVFTYASGVVAEVAAGWTFVAGEPSIEVLGIAGTAILSGVDLASREFVAEGHLRWFREGDTRGVWRRSPTVPYSTRGISHFQGPRLFLESLRTGAPPPLGIREGRAALAMILAAYRAAEHGGVEAITEVRDRGPSRLRRGGPSVGGPGGRPEPPSFR